MRLQALLERIDPIRAIGAELAPDLPLSGASSDSRIAEPGELFIAYPGLRSQGVDHLDAAFGAGCPAALVPDDVTLETRHRERCIAVGDFRRNAALVSAALFGEPTQRLLTFGVTGTNGKTSSCHILRHILENCGHRVAMLTTVAQEFGEWRLDTPNTTPDAPLVQKLLARAAKEGATAGVIEVSAHGIWLDRVLGCRFDGVLFTNLTLDHQEAFDGIEPYFRQKQRLFVDAEYHKAGCVAAIGTSDEFGARLLGACSMPAVGFGWNATNQQHYASAAGLEAGENGIRGRIVIGDKHFDVDLPLKSRFNCLNITGAVALAELAGLDGEGIARALETPFSIPGRMVEVPAPGRPFRVVVDFAYTGSAMENLLTGLRGECEGRLIVVFGAGGDRDPARRRTLPEAVIANADVGVITTDNPRSESPQSIIDAMCEHWEELASEIADPPRLQVEADRVRAIEWAIGKAGSGDIVVIAGKGHESTQVFADRVVAHDDIAIASEVLSR